VANADRRLPLLDHTVSMAISMYARRHPAECARVLLPGGVLLVSVPAPDDLIELREAVQGTRVEKDRTGGVDAEHAGLFTLVERTTLRARAAFDRAGLLRLLASTYRGARTAQQQRIETLDQLEVTLATDVLLFERVMTAVAT